MLIMFSACSFHSGIIDGVAPPVSKNFKYVGNAVGESQATYVFGFGGLGRTGLVREAKNNLIQNYPVKNGQALVNFTIDHNKQFLFFGLLWVHKVYITADILEYK